MTTTTARDPDSESTLATRLVLQHGDDLLYCPERDEDLVWDGRRWRRNASGEVQRRLSATLGDLRDVVDDDDWPLADTLRRAERRSARNSIVQLARHEVRHVQPEELDSDPYLFNCLNGTIDLRTGQLRDHDRSHLVTQLVPVTWDPTAECPRWKTFLERVMPDAATVTWLQKAVGYSLTGDVREQVVFVLQGTGANGKSTFLATLLDLLGAYGEPADVRLLAGRGRRQTPLFRRRTLVISELPPGGAVDESRLKVMTGGDRLVGEAPGEPASFAPSHKLWIATNEMPRVKGREEAIWRRLRIVAMPACIGEAERDASLPEQLRQELPGILRWAVEGCLLWQAESLGLSAEVHGTTNIYRASQDLVLTFVLLKCVRVADGRVTTQEFAEAYNDWAMDRGAGEMDSRVIGRRLGELGFESDRSRRLERAWKGLALASPEDAGEQR